MQDTTNLVGIPIPSTDKTFLIFVVIHILIGLSSVISGLLAMLSTKGGKRHIVYGKVYFWSMLSAFVIVIILSLMRWPHNTHLLGIGTCAAICTFIGYRTVKVRKRNWPRVHTLLMGSSYILLLTGFYVDNGKNLPFWKLFPQWFFWIMPSLIGIPIIINTLRRHPLNRKVLQ